ncbi:hypothetical protein J2I47_01815 [Fibrella sp. HMF5335]|uniref:DUF5683 domain-containing protein n=1 Tax=Fibrella rubiginis TaxID=2817060 RepID=A0A939K4D3_9BACT|nr:hypothetical protein [Fibrella rubiginis]MBO0935275.1 hypothetical protein [Fibrella rubiginis]
MNQSGFFAICLATLLATCLFSPPVASQPVTKGAVLVSNVRVDLDTNRVKVLYDATGMTPHDSVYIQVESRERGLLHAVTVTGDVGTEVLSGRNKTIYWDYRLDGIHLDDAIRVTVLVKQPGQLVSKEQVTVGGGPTNALLSVLAPGVGTIFVQPNRKIGLRPLLTGAYVGLWIYGLARKSQSTDRYDLYTRQLNWADYTEANQLHHQYLVASWAAVALLLTDVTYTFLRGRKNEQLKRAARQRVGVRYSLPRSLLAVGGVGTTPTIGIRVSF